MIQRYSVDRLNEKTKYDHNNIYIAQWACMLHASDFSVCYMLENTTDHYANRKKNTEWEKNVSQHRLTVAATRLKCFMSEFVTHLKTVTI